MRKYCLISVLVLAALVLVPASSFAVSIGLKDTFTLDEQNWFAGGLGPPPLSNPPIPPNQIPSGGPLGAGDGFLQITASEPFGAGSRVVAINGAQWAGNYLAAGVNAIGVDLQNQGATPLTVRFLFEDPLGAPPTDEAVTAFGAFLPAHSPWLHFLFPVDAASLVPQIGNVNALLANVTLLRIINSTAPDEADSLQGVLGVDNITASNVPEPATMVLMISGAGVAAWRRRRRA
jgi:hypothetical protein